MNVQTESRQQTPPMPDTWIIQTCTSGVGTLSYTVENGQPSPHSKNFLLEIWLKFRPRFIAWFNEVLTCLMLLTGFGIMHFGMKVLLSRGWIPWLAHALDTAEEIASAMIL
jgi:hypothetical protein